MHAIYVVTATLSFEKIYLLNFKKFILAKKSIYIFFSNIFSSVARIDSRAHKKILSVPREKNNISPPLLQLHPRGNTGETKVQCTAGFFNLGVPTRGGN